MKPAGADANHHWLPGSCKLSRAGRKKEKREKTKKQRIKKTKARRVVQTVLLEFKVEEKQPKKTNEKERQNGCFKEKKDYPGVKWRGKTALIKLPGII